MTLTILWGAGLTYGMYFIAYILCVISSMYAVFPLQWRHNERDGVSNHQPHNYLLNRLFMHRSKNKWKFSVTGLCEGNSSPHKGPVTRKMFPFDDIIMVVFVYYDGIAGKGPVMKTFS